MKTAGNRKWLSKGEEGQCGKEGKEGEESAYRAYHNSIALLGRDDVKLSTDEMTLNALSKHFDHAVSSSSVTMSPVFDETLRKVLRRMIIRRFSILHCIFALLHSNQVGRGEKK